jgi:hypothetical protein
MRDDVFKLHALKFAVPNESFVWHYASCLALTEDAFKYVNLQIKRSDRKMAKV